MLLIQNILKLLKQDAMLEYNLMVALFQENLVLD